MGKGIFYAYLAYTKSIEDGNSEARENILKLLKKNCTERELTVPLSFVESPFELEVYEYLTDHIEKERIVTQYEFGGFRIDFVIKSTVNGKPVIALECDGAQYHSSEEAYMQDIYRQKIIEREAGLKFYRIWSTNWWVDPHKEIQKLVEFINNVDEKDKKQKEGGKQLAISDQLRFSDEPIAVKHEQTLSPVGIKPKGKVVRLDSTVTIKNIKDGKKMTVKFTKEQSQQNLKAGSLKVIHEKTPLGVSLMDKSEGDKFKIDGIEIYYEVVEIKEP